MDRDLYSHIFEIEHNRGGWVPQRGSATAEVRGGARRRATIFSPDRRSGATSTGNSFVDGVFVAADAVGLGIGRQDCGKRLRQMSRNRRCIAADCSIPRATPGSTARPWPLVSGMRFDVGGDFDPTGAASRVSSRVISTRKV